MRGDVDEMEGRDMTGLPGIVERAYQIARSGRAADVDDIKAVLKREGYLNVAGGLTGPILLHALRDLCAASREPLHRK
jgi:hypothetical protein